MKSPIAIAVTLTILLGCCAANGAEPQSLAPADAQSVLAKLQSNAGGNWWAVRVGSGSGTLNVNWGANRHCVLVDGRRFVDAVSFTGVVGWYPRAQQLVGTFYFDDGDCLLVRAAISSVSAEGQLSLSGTISGTFFQKPVDGPFTARLAAEQWTFELKSADGTSVTGLLSGPRSPVPPGSAKPAQPVSSTPSMTFETRQ